MTKMVSLKRTAAEKKAEKDRYSKPMSSDEYDYCTRLTLDGKTLEKLGLDVTKLDVDQKVTITAKAFVKSLRSAKGTEYDRDSLELQMTDIAIDTTKKSGAIDALSKGIEDAGDDSDE